MTDSDGPLVRDFQEPDRDQVLDVLAESMAGFPPIDIIAGTDSAARERRRKLFESDLQPASRHHVLVAETSAEVTGALIYADAPHCFATSPGMMLTFVRIAGLRVIAAMKIYRQVARAHPQEPHRHLSVMGVDAARQGAGIGGVLMSEYVRRCDEAGLDGYLETYRWADATRPSHERFYGRYGFEVAREIGSTEEGTGLTMRRPAVPAGGQAAASE
jgi:ribosomal protein S18 acetylase RimI-like enzyme